MGVQFQPDPSSSRRGDLGSAEDRPEASVAPDASHLWLVSEGGVAVQGGWGGAASGAHTVTLLCTRLHPEPSVGWLGLCFSLCI